MNRYGKVTDTRTRYYGIYLQHIEGNEGWYLYDDLGGERWYPAHPTEAEIDAYRDEIWK